MQCLKQCLKYAVLKTNVDIESDVLWMWVQSFNICQIITCGQTDKLMGEYCHIIFIETLFYMWFLLGFWTYVKAVWLKILVATTFIGFVLIFATLFQELVDVCPMLSRGAWMFWPDVLWKGVQYCQYKVKIYQDLSEYILPVICFQGEGELQCNGVIPVFGHKL